MKKAVLGVLATRAQVESAVLGLQRAGFSNDDISVLFPDDSGAHGVPQEHTTRAPEGAVAGGSAGGILGGTLGLLAGIGALAIPGLGPFIAAGPIMATLTGAAAGAAVGGIAGALVGLGIPEIEARLYEGKLRSGNILVSVHADDAAQIDRAKQLLHEYGASDVMTAGEQDVFGGVRS